MRWLTDFRTSVVVATHTHYLEPGPTHTDPPDVDLLEFLDTRIEIPRVPSAETLARILEQRIACNIEDTVHSGTILSDADWTNGHHGRTVASTGGDCRLTTAVTHRRHSSSEIERAVLAHLVEHGRITNQVVRGLFGVGTPRASVILRELVNAGLVERTSEATRGPAVKYGPGPLIPF